MKGERLQNRCGDAKCRRGGTGVGGYCHEDTESVRGGPAEGMAARAPDCPTTVPHTRANIEHHVQLQSLIKC